MASILEKGPLRGIMKLFGGTKHERDVKRLEPLVDQINEVCASLESLSDEELKGKTQEFRDRIAQGETPDDLLPEAFAVVKDACRRNLGHTYTYTEHESKWDMVPFDVQLMGAIALHEGKIAEMATGEGKTLVAIMPLYLNALSGKGAHLITVNDYLAKRDSEWVGEILRYLGLTVGCIQNWMTPDERKNHYNMDVTYGTNNEFGFDYLRDNMSVRPEDRVQRPHHFAIVDEVDSVLIDEARTPLIISGPVSHSIQMYAEMKPHVEKLVRLQSRRMTEFLKEAEGHLEKAADDADEEYKAGIRLLQVQRGQPKHKRLFKLLADDPGLNKLIQRVEADYMREKQVHVLDEEIHYAIDERAHTVNISDDAQKATDRALFHVPVLSERLDWIDRCGDLTDEERADGRLDLLEDTARRIIAGHNRQAAGQEKVLEQITAILEDYLREFGEAAQAKQRSEIELEQATLSLRERWSDKMAEVIPAGEKAVRVEGDEDDEDLLFDFAWKMGTLVVDLDPTQRAALKDAVNRDYAVRSERIHNIQTLLKAYALYEKDVEYVLQEGKILIVDQFTGRLMPGRRFSDGLHQALEAKEGVKIEGETQTLATITIQNYFRLYEKLAGMTGTAETEASEFFEIYGLDVVVIPTNQPIARADLDDVIYRTTREKYNAAIDEIERLHKLGLPALVGTVNVDVSETLSRLLKRRGIKHNVLNAKHHQKEAEIIRHAGRAGAVTIATNMAGRGTDIKLAADIGQTTAKEDGTPGGLQVIGTARHESRRIDRQLRGRSGRQGDPGATRFFISLEDDLMRLFQAERISKMMTRLGADEGEAIEHPMVTKSVERAQKRVEGRNFDVRKHLLEYDNVMNQQREIIYGRRNYILDGGDTSEEYREMMHELIDEHIDEVVPAGTPLDEIDIKPLISDIEITFLTPIKYEDVLANAKDRDELGDYLKEQVGAAYERREDEFGTEVLREVERQILLRTIDEKWRDHLYEIDQVKSGASWASVGGKDPLLQYKKEAYELFALLNSQIRDDVLKRLFRVQVQVGPPQPTVMAGVASHPAADAPRTPAPAGGRPAPELLLQRARAAQAARTARTIEAVVGPARADKAPAPAPVPEKAPPPPEPEPVATKPAVDALLKDVPRSPMEGVRAGRPEAGEPVQRRTPDKKVGRNDPCPCGSGKKYKKCHGA